MKSSQLRRKYIDFFIGQGHKEIPSSSLVPENDPTTLFTGSGMQPLIPYLMGEGHPLGKRLVNSQTCFRAEDIEEVGNNRHTTFFEMLGNWSLGDYFKKEQLPWFFEFLTKVVGLEPERLYASVFQGNELIPKDGESIKIWQELFKTNQPDQRGEDGFRSETKIYSYGADKNWWSRVGVPENMPPGEIGGPDSEVFYDFGPDLKLHENSVFKDRACHINCGCGRFLEIGNSVFMEYEKKEDGSFERLPQKNVDFGGGLERILAVKIDSLDIFKTDLFWPIIKKIEGVSDKDYQGNENPMRIIADHLKAATFMISQGLEPSNKLQGYILRRLLRRAAVKMHRLKGDLASVPEFKDICSEIIEIYQGIYFKQGSSLEKRLGLVIDQEMGRFSRSLSRGLKEIEKCPLEKIDAKFAFDLFQSYGFPLEISQELLAQRGYSLNKAEFDQEFERHKELSRTASRGMFKGGLADSSEEIVRLHTATHLLHSALRRVLGSHIEQAGSNITVERLRFDFNHSEELGHQEIKEVEDLVNEKIKQGLPVRKEEMSYQQAIQSGALAFFKERYPKEVSVYTIGDGKDEPFSKEICAGPHVQNTAEIGGIKIIKEESAGTGIRRIRAVLTNNQ